MNWDRSVIGEYIRRPCYTVFKALNCFPVKGLIYIWSCLFVCVTKKMSIYTLITGQLSSQNGHILLTHLLIIICCQGCLLDLSSYTKSAIFLSLIYLHNCHLGHVVPGNIMGKSCFLEIVTPTVWLDRNVGTATPTWWQASALKFFEAHWNCSTYVSLYSTVHWQCSCSMRRV